MTPQRSHIQQYSLSGSIDEYEEKSPSFHQLFQLNFDYYIAFKKWLPSHRRKHKVSRPLRVLEQRSDLSVYEPLMVSLGLYHYGKFLEVDEFKHLCLHWFTDGNKEIMSHLYDINLGMIDRVRNCYAEVSIVNRYDDNNLALMMLLDGCFIINFMNIRVSNGIAKDSYNCLGVAGALPFTARDIMLLENQIPFFVLKLLLSEILGKEQAQFAVEKLLNALMSMQSERAIIPREDEDPPIHILEACRRVLAAKHGTTHSYQQYQEPSVTWISSAEPEYSRTKPTLQMKTLVMHQRRIPVVTA